ncbi:MAG: transporter substrate-binding domain-containing protein [Phycisphaerales bacterium]|nr:transporter substrate-binding domain-containing protein [Phycisphaerales bacterium]
MNWQSMTFRRGYTVLVAMACWAGCIQAAPATPVADPPLETPRAIKVGVLNAEPFAIPDTAMKWTGYAVVMFEASSIHARVVPEFREYASANALIDAVASGEVDAGVGNTLVTSERLERVDFSQPFLDAGLRVMVPSEKSSSFFRVIDGLVEGGHARVLAWCFAGALGLTVAVSLLLRRFDRDFTPHLHEGLAESFHHVVSVAVTGKTSYKGGVVPPWVGRIVAAIWLLFGLATVAYLTSTVTSVMTVDVLHRQINGPKDLRGKTIGIVAETGGDTYCSEQKLDVVRFKTLEAAAQAMIEHQIDAVVGDASILEYYELKHADVKVNVVGELFQRRHFGFSFHRDGTNLREKFDIAILALRENGTLDQIRQRWFGY